MGTYVENDFLLDASSGLLDNYSASFRFGKGEITTDITTIWSGSSTSPGLYIRPSLSGEIIYISSSSADDTNGGAGAWTIKIEGLDTNLEYQEELVTLNGQTQVATTKTFSRVCNMFVHTAGSSAGSVGSIYAGEVGASSGVPSGNLYGHISNSSLQINQSQSSCFTTPIGYELYIYGYQVSAKADNREINFFFCTRDIKLENSVWKAGTSLVNSGEIHNTLFPVPRKIDEGFDMEWRAMTDRGLDVVTGSYLYLLKKKR